MVKLKSIRLYDADRVPENIIEEIEELIRKMDISLRNANEGHSSNIILSAFNRFHASIICELISENDLINAAKTEAIGLIKNVESISGIKIWQGEN